MFLDCYRDAYDKCFPLRTIKCGYRTGKPWLSEGLKRSIQTKSKLYHRKQKSKRLAHEIIYEIYRNKLNKFLLVAERKHYEHRLEENKCNLKGSWCVLKEMMRKMVLHHAPTSSLMIKLQMTSMFVANGFNSFFINTGANLAKSIPSDTRYTITFIQRNPHSMAIMTIIHNDGDGLRWNFDRNQPIFIREDAFKNVGQGWRPFCLGHNVLILVWLIWCMLMDMFDSRKYTVSFVVIVRKILYFVWQ